MIPKIIHYCWFGNGQVPEKEQRCIDSWKRVCPDYEIKRWDESNYDYTKNKYMREAYEAQRWGFVSDCARLDIVYTYGGFYLDTDVELIKPLDEFLNCAGYMGFEDHGFVNSGLGFGAEKGNKVIEGLRNQYDELSFYNTDGSMNLLPCPYCITDYLESKGLVREDRKQVVDGLEIFPREFFAPKNYHTGELTITENTVSIHHYSESWRDKKDIYYKEKERQFVKRFGNDMGHRMARIYSFPYRVIRRAKRVLLKNR